MPLRTFTRLLPCAVDIVGRRRDVLLSIADRLCRPTGDPVTIAEGFTLDPSQPNQRLLLHFFHNMLRGVRQSDLWGCMRCVLHGGELFVDIGANLGLYSYLARKRLGCDAWLFEPEPVHAAFLRRNAHLLGTVHEVALSDCAGEAEFHVGCESNRGGSSLVRGCGDCARSGYDRTITVRQRRLDEILTDPAEIRRIGLVKIDVEGAEAAVVGGLAGVLDRATPPIWCEVRGPSSDRNPDSYREVIDLLAGRGYRPWVWTPHGRRLFRKADIRRVFDLLFLPVSD